MIAARAAHPERPYPSLLRGWMIVIVLIAAYAISFVDRQILSLLVEDLRRDLGISDSQIGLLQGPAFGIFYAVMGLPFGWLADRTHRIRLIAAGLFLWTIMTLLGGLADSFEMLFLARMGVGVGEAALVPAAVSLLADSFAPSRRALPLSSFTAGISIGAGLALIIGGALVGYAESGVSGMLLIGAWLAGRETWQTVLILAGLGGIPLALLILFLPEPVRRAKPRSTDGGEDIRFIPYLKAHRRLFIPLLAGSSLLYIFSNGLAAWMPTLFVRAFGWTPMEVGLRLGSLILVFALCGNLLSGTIATFLMRRGDTAGPLRAMILGACLLAPAAILGPLAPTAIWAQAGIVLIYFCIALCFGIATATFVTVTPGPVRGQMVALYLLVGNLVGLGLGPPSIGFVIEHILGDPSQVGQAIALIGAAIVIPGAFLLARSLPAFRARSTDIRD